MPAKKRFKTKYPGVHYIEGKAAGSGRKERIYYIVYRKDGKLIEEKAGRQFQDGMTPAKARRIRIECLEGRRLPRKEIRRQEKAKKKTGKKFIIKAPEKENNGERLFKKKWLLFMQSATEGFALLDASLNVVEMNNAVWKIFPAGMKKEDIIGKNLLDLLPHTKGTGEYEHYLKVTKTGEPFILRDIIAPQRFGEDIHLNFRGFKVGEGVGVIITDISDSKRKEKALKKSEARLQLKARELEEANTALKVLLKGREKDRTEVEENMVLNVRELVQPYLEKLKNERLSDRGKSYVNIVESNLNNIISPFVRTISHSSLTFTHAEIQIANLVKYGKTTKEMANFLGLSFNTIESYRKRIRKKLGINNQKINLRTYLSSLE